MGETACLLRGSLVAPLSPHGTWASPALSSATIFLLNDPHGLLSHDSFPHAYSNALMLTYF